MADRLLCQLAVSFLLGIATAWTKLMWLLPVTILFWLCICINLIWNVNVSQKQHIRKILRIIVCRVSLCLSLFLMGTYRCETQLSTGSRLEILQEERMESTGTTESPSSTELSVIGQIYKKEEKNQQVIYYLKNAYLQEQKKYYSCNNILVYPDLKNSDMKNLSSDTYSIGNTIYVKGSYKPFREARNEGNFDEKSFYQSKNIFFAITSEEIHVLNKGKGAFQEKLYMLKKNMLQVYEQLLPEKEAGILAVMSIGDKELLDTEMKQLYQKSGISHILAISGLHVSILGAGIYRLLRKMRMATLPACIIGTFFVCSFGILSGMEVSTQRAVMMFLVLMGANAIGMAYDLLTSLCFSMLVQLWCNPLSVCHAGFLFSYAAVLGVAIFPVILGVFQKSRAKQSKKERFLIKNFKKASQTIGVSLCIQFTTLPLTLYYFYEFPVFSIIINGILLPFMGVLLSGGLIGGLLGIFNRKVGWFVLQPSRLLLTWNEWVCRMFQGIPGAVCITGKPDVRLLIGYYAVLAGVLLCLKLLQKREASRWSQGVFLTLPAVALCCVLFFRPAPEFEIALLDVGQGDGIYIQSEEGMHFFVDGGSSNVSKVGEYRILPFLKSRGVSRIDGWFVSHGDADHISGLKEIWEQGYTIDCLILAEGMVRDESFEELKQMALAHGTKIKYLSIGQKAGTKSLTFTCMHPDERVSQVDKNGASMVLKMEQEGFTALFTGDISVEQEKIMVGNAKVEEVDFYKAAHHGSGSSNGNELLQILKPRVSVISCAKKNSYGHPTPEAVARIEGSGSRIFYTMESGQVTVKCIDGQILIKQFKDQM